MISILMLLLNKRKLTAKELSEYFEVSVRTIQRDMDTLCNAGIPIYGDVGKYGGYQLTENYKLNRSFLTLKEMDTLVVMLRGFKDTLFTDSIRTILEKMGSLNKTSPSINNFHIDMAPWGAESEFAEKLNAINKAIEEQRILSFKYYDLYSKKTDRTIEPYTILLKSNSWYIYGYCLLREEYRMFKITRIYDLDILTNHFVPRDDVLEPDMIGKADNDRESTTFKIRFAPQLRSRIPDYFDLDKSIEEDDGSIVHISSFPVDEWLYSLFMSFGSGAEILEPRWLRDEVINRIKKMNILYKL